MDHTPPPNNNDDEIDDFLLIKKKKIKRPNKAELDFDSADLTTTSTTFDFASIFAPNGNGSNGINDVTDDNDNTFGMDLSTNTNDILLLAANSNNNIAQSTRISISKHNIIQMKITQQKELYKERRLKEYGIIYKPIMYYDEFMRDEELRTGGNSSTSRRLNEDGTYNEEYVKRKYFAGKVGEESLFATVAESLDSRSTIRQDTTNDNDQNGRGNAINGIALVELGLDAKKEALERTEIARNALVSQYRTEFRQKHPDLSDREIDRLIKEKIGHSQDNQTFQDRKKAMRK